MNLRSTFGLHAAAGKKKKKKVKGAAGGQTDSSSFIGRKYIVQDHPGYGHYIGEYDTPEEAEHASRTRPYSRVISRPRPENTPEVRDMARQRLVKTNPDVT